MTLKFEGEKLVGECTSRWDGDLRSHTKFDKTLHITMDEPEELIGTGKGPSPMEVMLASISGCAIATFSYIANKMKLEIRDISVVTKGEAIHHDGTGWRIIDIETNVEVKVSPGIPSEKVDECFRQYQHFSPVKNSIETGVPIRVSLNQIAENE